MPRTKIIKAFAVSRSMIKRSLKLRRETGDVKPKAIPGRPSKKGVALHAGMLPQREAHPDATLVEHCQFWEATRGIQVSSASMSGAIWRLIWTRMKKTLRALRGKESVLVRSVQHPRMLAHSELVSPTDALLLLVRSARETHGLPLARARPPGANDGHPCQCPDCDQPEG
jgi:transposase